MCLHCTALDAIQYAQRKQEATNMYSYMQFTIRDLDTLTPQQVEALFDQIATAVADIVDDKHDTEAYVFNRLDEPVY